MTKDRVTVLLLGDILALTFSLIAMLAIRFHPLASNALIPAQVRIFLFLFVVWLIIFFIFDLYNLRNVNPTPRTIGLLAIAVATSATVSGLLFYLFPTDGITPKTNLAILAGISFVALTLWRRSFYKLFASRYSQKIALLGSGPAIDHLRDDLARHPHIGTIVYTSPSYDPAVALPSVDLVIVDGANLEGIMQLARATGGEVLSLLGAYEELFAKVPLSHMTEERAISILTKQSHGTSRLLGRLLECLLALAVLLVASPFLLLAVLAILIEDGAPALYRQQRVGKGGTLFSIYKLRTMKKDAEATGAQWAQKRDSRITRVGRILRKTHLDEVPQMLNILRGDIALIGPRPERPEFVTELEQKIPYYFLRHAVKPGFTGWAQIKFRYARSELDSKEKFEYDLYYLFKKNPLFDLGIFLKTVQIIFTH